MQTGRGRAASCAALVAALSDRFVQPDGAHASFREPARAAGVNVATLRHYFADRAGVLSAVYEASHQSALGYPQEVAAGQLTSFRASLDWYVGFVVRSGAQASFGSKGPDSL